MFRNDRSRYFRHAFTSASLLLAVQFASAAWAEDAYALFDSIPAPPASLSGAQAATQVAAGSGSPSLVAPAYDAVNTRIRALLQPKGSVGGFDLGRASSDPAYAAQMQARMQNMSQAEKMAMAQQMMASQQGAAGSPGSTAAVAGFLGGQRPADLAAQQKMRALIEGALAAAGAKHKASDTALTAAAKACPQDKTGWPLESCTKALGTRSIAEHRAIEAAALGSELQAYTQARTIAQAELAKGRSLFASSGASPPAPLIAWAMIYAQMLRDYGDAITVRAAFWSRADQSKYTGQVTVSIGTPGGGEIGWPLESPHVASAKVGL